MNKLKSKLLAHKIVTGFMALVLTVGLVGLTVAFSSEKAPQNVFENVGNVNIAAPVELPVAPVVDETFGSVTSPYLPGPDFAVGKDFQFSVSAELADATSTFAFAVPFRKTTTTASDVVVETITAAFGLTVPTTTIELVRASFTSSTPTAFSFGCASSNNQYTTSTNGVAILTADAIPATITGVVENGLATAAGAQVSGGTVTKIMLGPSHPYLVCRIYSAALTEFSARDNVSPGGIVVRFSRVQ